ncbi:MAG: hypothetical protein Q7K28_03390, partial [Candidatus Wildermuthbacteria bacterium]|nr:hypothetical protein [Candidatus Wildermuthbacteria bacterium]
IWFEVRPDSKAIKKISNFLDIYLTNFIENKLTGKPQDFNYSLIKPQNFYTFEKHRSQSKYELRSMQEKYGNRFVITGPLNKDPEFLYIHFLLASEKLGHIKIHRLSTNSGAYTHGDDPQWETDITLQPNFDTPNSSLKKVNTGPSLGSKKREWIEFFKKMDVVMDGENLMEELNEESDGYGQTTWKLLERTDMIMAEDPVELKKLNWVFQEYNSTPYSLEKSKAIIIASLNKLSEKYENIPLVYTTLPFPSYMNFTSEVWREILSIHSFEKEDYGHIDFLNALASLAAEKTIGILFFETLAIDSKILVFKATIIEYKKKLPAQDVAPDIKAELSFDENKSVITYGKYKCEIPKNTNQYFLCQKMFKEPAGKRIQEIEILDLIDWDKDSKRSVYDAMRAVNKRTNDKLKIKQLFEWRNN